MSDYNDEIYAWKDVFQDDNLVSTRLTSLIMFDGLKVTVKTKYLELDHVILIYIPNMLSEDIFESILRLISFCYEGTPLYKNKNKNKGKNS